MHTSLPKQDLIQLVERQLSNLFLFDPVREAKTLRRCIERALSRVEICFGQVDHKYFKRDGQAAFNPYHAGQYAVFLYFLSRSLCVDAQDMELADKVYYLNRALNSVDLYHEAELPEVFYLEHPLGTVLGRARYGERFIAYQRCTVGGNHAGGEIRYPSLGAGVTLYAGATVLGQSVIGDNCVLAANTYVINAEVPANSLVFGASPDLVVKTRSPEDIRRHAPPIFV